MKTRLYIIIIDSSSIISLSIIITHHNPTKHPNLLHHYILFIISKGWCKGEEKGTATVHDETQMETTLCTSWYKYKEAREEAARKEKPMPHLEPEERPDMNDVKAMHNAWCKHEGHSDFGPCLMWKSGPGKDEEL